MTMMVELLGVQIGATAVKRRLSGGFWLAFFRDKIPGDDDDSTQILPAVFAVEI